MILIKPLHQYCKNNKGFTLVELAIVMIIIGLIIGGVLKGQELVNNARVIKTIKQIKEQKAAYYLFKNTFNAIPGDMPDATSRLPGCTGNCLDGNGNGLIGNPAFSLFFTPATFNSENMQYWYHLAVADMISNVQPDPSGVHEFGRTTPSAALRGGFHARSLNYMTRATGGYTIDGNALVLINRADGSVAVYEPNGYVATPLNAFKIDTKLDDGHAQFGFVQSWSHNWGDGCGDPNFLNQGPNGYDLQNGRKICEMAFAID